jgi:hypothetical protein
MRVDTPNGGDRNPRGSKPPLLSLSEAFALTQKIYEQGGGKASFDLFSKITGNSRSSSSFIKKVNSLKTYGLAGESEKGTLEISSIGLAIVAPKSPEAANSAKMDSFLRLDVFARIHERHKGKLLPADEFIKNIIEQECGKPRDLSDEWVSAFKNAAKTVGILHDRGDGKTQIMESPILRLPRVTEEAAPQSTEAIAPAAKESEPLRQSTPTAFLPLEASGHLTKIEISGGRYALFNIPDRLTNRDAQRLKGALAGLSQIIDSMVNENETTA